MKTIELRFQRNKNSEFLEGAFEQIAALKRDGQAAPRWVLLEGSARSGKTWAIFCALITAAANPAPFGRDKLRINVFRAYEATCSDTLVPDFLEILGKYGLFAAGTWRKMGKTFTFANGSTIAFRGTDEAQKLQGFKSDITWFNEAMEVSDDARSQLEMRTTLFCVADWNPSATEHWIFDRVLTSEGDYLYCHSTFEDNRDLDTGQTNLTPAIIESITRMQPTPDNIRRGTADPYKWDVYGLGKRGVREGQVFPRICWDVVDFFPAPEVRRVHGYGLDFGFSGDPTALVECAVANNVLFVRQLVYETGLFICPNPDRPTLPSLKARMDDLGVSKSDPIYADSAEPEGIAQLQASGYNVIAARKAPGSINFGLDLLRQRRIAVHRASVAIQKELENYAYKRRVDGTFTDVPEDKFNHAVDAMRYFALNRLTGDAMAFSKVRPRILDDRTF